MINLRRFVYRAYSGQRLGLRFTGTSRFKLPPTVRLGRQQRKLSFPDDKSLTLDIIEGWLDDDYGLGDIARPVNTFVDIGANVGLFSLWAWHHFPAARIDAYEPNPAVLPYLASNLEGLPTVRIFREGVADKDGWAHVVTRESSRLAQMSNEGGGDIGMTSIRRVIDRIGGAVDLLKLDCEGGEWLIFREAESLGAVREIRMEYHLTEGRTIEDLRAASRHIGFDLWYLRENQGFGIAYLINKQRVD